MKKQRRAFTLVELLVVLGIIALLISILMPALRRAKEVATRAVCMSNHQNLARAIILYAGDWKGKLPEANWDAAFTGPNRLRAGWLYDCTANARDASTGALIPASGIGKFAWDDPQRNNPRTGVLWKYLKSKNIYRCPFDMEPWLSGFGAQYSIHNVTSYGLNGAICAYGANPGTYKLENFKPDDILIWELDENYNTLNGGGGADIFNDAANFPSEPLSMRHGTGKLGQAKTSGGIITSATGTVEWITQYEFNKMGKNKVGGQGDLSRSRLWCIPRQASRDGHTIP